MTLVLSWEFISNMTIEYSEQSNISKSNMNKQIRDTKKKNSKTPKKVRTFWCLMRNILFSYHVTGDKSLGRGVLWETVWF